MSRADAAHLLRRVGFAPTLAEIDQIAALDRVAAVDQVLDTRAATTPPDPAFLTDAGLADWQKHQRLQWWWLDRMRATATPIVEKLTLFWHNHFVSAQGKLYDIALLHRQNQLYRRLALGNYRDLVQQMAIEPAMLEYLDNASNRSGVVQENFGRELLELFTLGQGNFTETDVVAMSRAWTGHNLTADGRNYQFYANRHDNSAKTLFGISRNWDGPAAVDELLLGSRQQAAARFLVAKLWSWFAHPGPPTAVVDDLTAAFVASGLEIRALLRAMLLRDEFWSTAARYALVRQPAEFVVATLRATGLGPDVLHPEWFMEGMGQVLYDPPNVAGWKQNGYWVSTSGYWSRAAWGRYCRWVASERGVFQGVAGLNAAAAVQSAFDRFGVVDASPATRAGLEAWCNREKAARRDWTIQPNILLLTMLTPDVNVC